MLLLSLTTHACLYAQGQKSPAARRRVSAKSMSPKQKLARAEAAADRLIERFHETLDFGFVLNENFVIEPNLRKRALRFGEESNLPTDIGEPLAERTYVALMNYLNLFAEYKLIQDQQEVPPEIDSSPLLKNFRQKTKMESPAEVEQFIGNTNQLSEMYRKYFSPESFKSRLYRQNIAEEQERARQYHHNVPRIEHGNEKFEISAQTPVYVVRREFFDYYFIEEHGVPKLFFINILPNFKLF